MFNLDTTTRSIEVLLGGAVATNQLPIVASYADSELPAYASFADLRLAQETQATNQTATNNTSVVTAVAAPGSGDQRRLKYLSVYNADTAEAIPTVRLNDNGTTRILAKPTLAVGDTLYYVEGIGFYVMDTNGAMKSAGTIPFATPSIVLGTAAAAGSGTSTIRSDATIAAFDSTVPGTSAVGDSAATGSVAFAARRDHTHGREAFATPSVVLSTAAAAGVAATLLRSDATIAAFDATVPVTQAFGDSAATGSVAFSARRDHTHGMPATPVTTLAGTAAEITASASTGAVTLSLPTALTFTGKTVTGGTLSGITLDGTNIATGTLRFNDSVTAIFGTGGDATIDYDGTNLLIKPGVVGGGHVAISTSDQVVLRLINTSTTSRGARMETHQDSSVAAIDGDVVFSFTSQCDDDTGTKRNTNAFQALFDDVTSTTMDSHFAFYTMNNVNADNANTVATLTAAGVWTDAPSFEELKIYETNLSPVEVLVGLKALKVGRYRGKDRPDTVESERHIGPTADGFYNMFRAGKDPRVSYLDKDSRMVPQYGIAAHDMAGVALMAIQALILRGEALEAK